MNVPLSTLNPLLRYWLQIWSFDVSDIDCNFDVLNIDCNFDLLMTQILIANLMFWCFRYLLQTWCLDVLDIDCKSDILMSRILIAILKSLTTSRRQSTVGWKLKQQKIFKIAETLIAQFVQISSIEHPSRLIILIKTGQSTSMASSHLEMELLI